LRATKTDRTPFGALRRGVGLPKTGQALRSKYRQLHWLDADNALQLLLVISSKSALWKASHKADYA
jgi:hypothetical protein